MARSLWSGSVSFGLVSVPVRVFSAVRSHDVRFHNLNPKTNARIRQRRVDAQTGEEVAYDDIVKGYDLGDGRHVMIDTEELDALAPRASREIAIEDFVDEADIDPIYYARPYYLGPANEAAGKAYRLLVEAMDEAGKVAIARFVMRGKEYLAALRVLDGVLVANTMQYADEVLPADEVEGLEWTDVEVSDRERQMATSLIGSLENDFDPERYRDEHNERLLELIKSKAEGRTIEVEEPGEPAGEVVDLMAALERSLEQAGAGTGRRAAKRDGNGQAASGKANAQASDYASMTKDELYELAQQRDVPGRSQMSKAQLAEALASADQAA